MNDKPWYASKTLWFNMLSVAVYVASGQAGIAIPANIAIPVLTGGNMLLRVLTGQPITGTPAAKV